MKPRIRYTRRDFLRCGCRTFSTIGTAAALGRLALVSSRAQPASDYKALVCVFLFGGNDANNMVVPLDAAGYTAYQSVRQTVSIAQAALLPISGAGGAPFGLHPSLAALHPFYAQNDLAVAVNVGMLVRPMTRAQYQNGTIPAPINLFSHSDQQQQWQNAAPLGGTATGWSGRVADRIQFLNAPSTFPPSVGISGNSLQLVGQATQPTTVNGTNFGLEGSDHTPAADARDLSLQEMLTLDSGVTLVQSASRVLGDAIRVAQLVDQAVTNATPLATVFPNTGLGQQLAQVARIIQVRAALGMRRQLFFCSQGGYDTHSNQLPDQAALLTELGQAMAAFYNATGEMGVRDAVTTFTESEFSRTFQPNGSAGTDHAWAGHQLLLGGAVNGGAMYGRFPTLALQGPDDSGSRGNWLPSVALDQYGATLASWFGVQAMDLAGVFPNIGNFPSANLGFMA